jgi:anhydro-N-acetylmuramic acid kinase
LLHGHTILQPIKVLLFKLEIYLCSDLLGQTVVCDFRVQDVLLGGQGAPLVPIGDRILFAEYDYCMNLGGFLMYHLKKGNRIDIFTSKYGFEFLFKSIGIRL